MTTAGIATVSFVAILMALYVAWTVIAAQPIWGRTDRFDVIGSIALFAWLSVHVIAVLAGLALLLEWLGSVAGWWGQ